MPLSGHCLCKAVTYTVDIDAPLITAYDHCDDSQRQSGSTYSLIAVASLSTVSSALSVVLRSPTTLMLLPKSLPPRPALPRHWVKQHLKPDTEIWTVSKLPFCQESLDHSFKHMPV
ncbi:Mss4-like [Penicillium digitatum]|uniref:CENP-V/GFA domain-containing protein n=3 Tax=Penicillium digitatum TaxID=36651 RepID=K9FZW1_PEND2|nr:hypothetical protein PDIP_04640 [Penicillium digitatum Pd1]EKV06556.1 hypothetical protein PDIG_77530 [Penicillium digitatum PHI26]EKV21628.1 hypothetical protein PDIP_04640 [Penicillium digitatum Pd1]QQK47457.1 Mss4-like [Penicillium digitatum]